MNLKKSYEQYAHSFFGDDFNTIINIGSCLLHKTCDTINI